MGPANFGETYGLAPSFLEALNIDGPLRSKLFVGNVSLLGRIRFLWFILIT